MLARRLRRRAARADRRRLRAARRLERLERAAHVRPRSRGPSRRGHVGPAAPALAGVTSLDAALREIAVRVAHGGPPEAIFAAISEQAAGVCGVSAAAVVRFSDDGAEIVGRWGACRRCPTGPAFALGGGGALTLVRNTGLPARFDEYAIARGEMGDAGPADGPARERRGAGGRRGRGVGRAACSRAFEGEHLPDDAEERLTEFAQLGVAGGVERGRARAAARVPRAAGDDRRRRAQAARAQPARRRAAAARRRAARAADGAQPARRAGAGPDPRRARAGLGGAARARPRPASRGARSAGCSPRSARWRTARRCPSSTRT